MINQEGWAVGSERRDWDLNDLLSLVQDRGKYVVIGGVYKRSSGMDEVKKTWRLIPKLKGNDHTIQGPWWCEEFNAEGCSIRIKCPNGHMGILTKHRMSKSGIVDPKIRCRIDDSNFNNWCFLDDFGFGG